MAHYNRQFIDLFLLSISVLCSVLSLSGAWHQDFLDGWLPIHDNIWTTSPQLLELWALDTTGTWVTCLGHAWRIGVIGMLWRLFCVMCVYAVASQGKAIVICIWSKVRLEGWQKSLCHQLDKSLYYRTGCEKCRWVREWDSFSWTWQLRYQDDWGEIVRRRSLHDTLHRQSLSESQPYLILSAFQDSYTLPPKGWDLSFFWFLACHQGFLISSLLTPGPG